MALLAVAACGSPSDATTDAAPPAIVDAAPADPFALDIRIGAFRPRIDGVALELSGVTTDASRTDPYLRVTFADRQEAAAFEGVLSATFGETTDTHVVRFDTCDAVEALGYDPTLRTRTELVYHVRDDPVPTLEQVAVFCYLDTRRQFRTDQRTAGLNTTIAGIVEFRSGGQRIEPYMIRPTEPIEYRVHLAFPGETRPSTVATDVGVVTDGTDLGTVEVDFSACIENSVLFGQSGDDVVWQLQGIGADNGQLESPGNACECGFRDGELIPFSEC